MTQQLLYSATQAAALLGVSPISFYRMRKTNKRFPKPRDTGIGAARWTYADLKKFAYTLPAGETRTPVEANAAVRAKRKQATN